ncbi:uncharacterized protein LOC129581939 [Paramacrobiotus metropolitanus]|uniref:uncharacterized protein LOC129581939 n=1 Tax=Paramacrobiotus metropolitanus TaxID=2943436 RepID=UPI002445659E|nr:uncharacterized protein LOC129581939 [Paramacrobiotus metropolitanus]
MPFYTKSYGFGIFIALALYSLCSADYTPATAQCNNQCDANTLLTGGDVIRLLVQTSDNDVGRSYIVNNFVAQMTLSLAMQNLRFNATNNFQYTTQFFSPFGNLVDSINGVKADASSQYWMLCVNGQFARCGMDTYRLNRGDSVSWKLVPFSRTTC